MNAIELLELQHRQVERLFSRMGHATRAAKKKLLEQIADNLAVHASIEEHQFYPAVKARRAGNIAVESLNESSGMKRVIADLLNTAIDEATFDAKIKLLEKQVGHHVQAEEAELFPQSTKVLDADELRTLGATMQKEQARLEAKGDPRKTATG